MTHLWREKSIHRLRQREVEGRRLKEVEGRRLTLQQEIERVEEYKYLGTTIDHKLTFKTNGDNIHSKCQQRLFFLRKMRKLQVRPSILQAFYKSFVESIMTFNRCDASHQPQPSGQSCQDQWEDHWDGPGASQQHSQEANNKKSLSNIWGQHTHSSHPLQHNALRPSTQILKPKKRGLNSFVPTSIRLLNA